MSLSHGRQTTSLSNRLTLTCSPSHRCSLQTREIFSSRHVPLSSRCSARQSYAVQSHLRRDRSWRGAASKEPRDAPTLLFDYIPIAIQAGATGTIAVFLGWMLHIDPFGDFHLSLRDTLIGLECALPVIILRTAAFQVPQPKAFSSCLTIRIATKDGVQIKKPIFKSTEQGQMMMFLMAMQLYKSRLMAQRMIRSESFWILASVWLLGTLPLEMLLRGVSLTTTGNYFRDRFVEAGMGADMFLSTPQSVDDLGKWCAVAMAAVVFLMIILVEAKKQRPNHRIDGQRATASLQMKSVIEKKSDRIKIDGGAIDRVFQSMDAAAKLSVVVESVIRLTSQIAFSSAFIATGNLMAPVTAGALCFLTKYTLTSAQQRQFKQQLPETDAGLKKAGAGSVVETVQSEKYRQLKSMFVEKIEQAEGKVDTSAESPPADDPPTDDKFSPKFELDLTSLVFLFRVTRNELTRDLTISDLTAADREALITETEDIDALIKRAARFRDDKRTPMKLNFRRDIKDRHRGDQ